MTAEPEDPQADPLETSRMSLGEHLEELRTRLIRGLLAVFVAFCIGWAFQDPIQRVVLSPLHQALSGLSEKAITAAETKLKENPEMKRTELFITDDPEDKRLLRPVETRPMQTGVTEGFLVTVRMVFYFALFVGAPFLLWQLWQFIAAGLYPNERKTATRFFPHSIGLFLTGTLFGYFVLVPTAMYFLIGFISLDVVRPEIKLSEYFTVLTALTLAIGFVFQLPLIMILLSRAGLVPPDRWAGWRRYFVMGAFVFAAMITPPDPYTLLMMATPTILLYETGAFIARRSAAPPAEPSAEGAAPGAAP